jgi:hypothetical protein
MPANVRLPANVTVTLIGIPVGSQYPNKFVQRTGLSENLAIPEESSFQYPVSTSLPSVPITIRVDSRIQSR